SRDNSPVRHADREVIPDGFDGGKANGLERDQLQHSFIFRQNKDLQVVEQNAEASQELRQMPLHPFADFKNAFVDVLHFGDLNDLINGLLDGRSGIISLLLGVDNVSVEWQVGD